MNKTRNIFVGVILMAIAFACVFLTALIYRANDRSSIKSYIFQMNDFAKYRVGELQDLNDISATDLRNKLIKKYVSEYFKVIPGDTSASERPILKTMSMPVVYQKWQETEAKSIQTMSDNNMFRIVHVMDDGIITESHTDKYDYDSDEKTELVYYSVRYYTQTWMSSNAMEETPIPEQGTIYIEARFKPGIKPDEYIVDPKTRQKISLRNYLESGYNPVGLFMFKVTNVRTKEM